MTEVEREREESEVEWVKEEAAFRDKVKHIKKSDPLFVEKM